MKRILCILFACLMLAACSSSAVKPFAGKSEPIKTNTPSGSSQTADPANTKVALSVEDAILTDSGFRIAIRLDGIIVPDGYFPVSYSYDTEPDYQYHEYLEIFFDDVRSYPGTDFVQEDGVWKLIIRTDKSNVGNVRVILSAVLAEDTTVFRFDDDGCPLFVPFEERKFITLVEGPWTFDIPLEKITSRDVLFQLPFGEASEEPASAVIDSLSIDMRFEYDPYVSDANQWELVGVRLKDYSDLYGIINGGIEQTQLLENGKVLVNLHYSLNSPIDAFDVIGLVFQHTIDEISVESVIVDVRDTLR